MGRKALTSAVLESYYSAILNAVKSNDGSIYADELTTKTGLNKGQIGKALQYSRRKFQEGNMKITDYVMASPNGYFVPTRGKEVIAYVIQNYLDVNSRRKTLMPILKYAQKHWNSELEAALMEHESFSDCIDDEMEAWAVFNKIINK